MSQHIYTYDPANDQLNEIGGAGHIIKDETGTSFTKRENLQFEGLKVTDDSTNNATVVEAVETNFVGTYAEWQALSLAERAQYDTVDLTDDFNGAPIDPLPSENSIHAVQSGGVYSTQGSLASLLTTAKNNLVAAINELFNKTNNKVLYFTSVACTATGSTTGNFATISNAAITADHVPAEIIFANPAAITSDFKCTTSAGSLTLNGICASATTAIIILTKKDN